MLCSRVIQSFAARLIQKKLGAWFVKLLIDHRYPWSRMSPATDSDTSRQGFQVGVGTANAIDDKVLVIAFEEGAATSAQAGVLVEWLQGAATKFPDVKIVFQFVP
jgi:hypothetical protein